MVSKILSFTLLLALFCIYIMLVPVSAQEIDKKLWQQALKIHNDAIVIDAHTHPMKSIFSNPDDLELGEKTDKSNINFVTMKDGGLDAFFFPLPLRNDINRENPSKKILDNIRVIRSHIKKYPDLAEIAFSSADIKKIHCSGKRAVLLSIEYSDCLEGHPDLLETYFKSGVRSITLSHTKLDPISVSGSNEPGDRLSPFGRKVIREMNKLGMLIDITHIPDKLQLDILKTSKAPVIASHSCVRVLNNIPRNIPDEILKEITKNNGAVMIGFSSSHLSNDYYKKFNRVYKEYMNVRKELNEKFKNDKAELHKQMEIYSKQLLPQSVNVGLLIDHIDHAVAIAGIDHVGLGTDFIRAISPIGLDTAEGYPLITYHLLQRGYKENEIKKILGENLLRIIEEVQKTSKDETSFIERKGLYLSQEPPGQTPEVFAPGIISHGFHEHNLTISPDGDEMFFTTSSSDYKHYAIIYVQRKNNVWSEPEIAPFSGKHSDMGPRFSPDGKKIYFCSKRPIPGSFEENSNYDLWVINKQGESLYDPVHLGSPINTDKNEAFPSIAVNGTIYYHYWEEKGSESDVYFSRFKNGNYQKPQRLEFGISTEYYEGEPFIAPDESYLLFQAIRPDSYHGNTNIYISYKHEDNTWSKPVNLGEAVNSSGYPISPMVSPDGKYLFFATNSTKDSFTYSGKSYSELIKLYKSHLNGYGTLWWVDAKIIEELKPEELK